MKITSIRRCGRTITLKGSFQREDLQKVLDMANAGEFERQPRPAAPSEQSTSVEADEH